MVGEGYSQGLCSVKGHSKHTEAAVAAVGVGQRG